MLNDFAEFDQGVILRKIACPVLVINGDGDSEELMLKEIAEKAMHYLPANSRHKIIPGAAHSFLRYLDQIIDLAIPWLEEHIRV